MRSRRSLPRPLAQHLADPVDEAALARVWGRVRAPRRRRRLAGVAATSVALAGLAWWLSPVPEAPSFVEAPALGPLRPLEAGAERTRERLADGSELVLAPGARVEPLAVGPARVVLHQTRGRVEYRVAPERARSFVVEAWPIAVEVTGTRFVVAREPERTSVEVLEGSVIVRGDGVPDGVARLGAGERVEATAPVVRGGAEPPTAPDVPERAPDPAPPESPAPRLPSQPAERVDWLAEADRARGEGRPADAVAPLERVAASGGRRAALAHYTLGRLWMDELDEPARAADALASAIDAGLPRTLEEPARHRHWAALVGAGRTERAVEAARAYLAEHPDGAHADPIRRWLEPHAP